MRSSDQAERRSTHSTPATSACRPIDQVAERLQRRQRARRHLPLVERHRPAAPRATAATPPAVEPGRRSSGVSASGSRRSRCVERVNHRLADAARRHVHHAPETHVVVRVDEEAQVRERVLDFLALVEPDAADDPVRRRPRASARLQSRATGRWCGTAPRSSSRVGRAVRLANRLGDEVGFLDLVAGART